MIALTVNHLNSLDLSPVQAEIDKLLQEEAIADQLVAKGVPKQEIVLAYHGPMSDNIQSLH